MFTAQQKKAAIDEIARANGGVVTPEAVVQTAKNPKHVLYEAFDWDDKRAAHKQRLDVARDLIASVEVVIEIEDVFVTAISYVRDARKDRREQGYVSIDALAKRREDSQATLLLELERIEGSIERARLIAGSLGLSSYFEAMLRNATEAKIRVQRRKKAA
jgi:hypothetical protein